jgi:hypothetical protein
MRQLFILLQRSFRSLRPVGRAGSEVEELAKDTKDTKDVQDHHNPFLQLPNELLLMIANSLDREFQVLLSLSCSRLRVLLNSRLDLSLCDRNVKLRFLQCLELDYPEHIPCRSCGVMFKWRARRLYDYRCPRVNSHSLGDRSTSCSWWMRGDQHTWVTREIVDLIFRAHERGQRYGLPPSFLSTGGIDDTGITRTNEACLVDGQLLLASRWEVDTDSSQDMVQKAWRFSAALCLHWGVNVWREKIWQTVEDAVAGMTGSEKPRMSKCPFCASEYDLCVQNSKAGRMKIVLNVRRNYEKRYANILSNEQIFCRDPSSRIDADALSRRNLHATFESYRSRTDSVRVC